MMKKFVIRIVVCVLTLVSLSQMSVGAFSDVNPDSVQGLAIAKMQEKGYIKGYGDNTFKPDATLTRAEFVTIINKMYMFYMESEELFSDVNKNAWYFHDVQTGVQAGYIKGMGNGRFAPDEPVTREQVCVMLCSLLNIEDVYYKVEVNDKVSSWAMDSVQKVLGIFLFTLEPGGKFRATEPITRGETCEVLEKCILEIDFEERFEPFDLKKLAREELELKLKNIVYCMETVVIPTYTDDYVIKVADMVVASMKSYIKDSSFDYVKAANDTYEVYRQFNGKQVVMFKNPIYENIEVEELAILFDFFYTPEMNFAP